MIYVGAVIISFVNMFIANEETQVTWEIPIHHGYGQQVLGYALFS